LETNHPQQDSAVDEEEKSIYEITFYGFRSNTVSQVGKYLDFGLELSIDRGYSFRVLKSLSRSYNLVNDDPFKILLRT